MLLQHLCGTEVIEDTNAMLKRISRKDPRIRRKNTQKRTLQRKKEEIMTNMKITKNAKTHDEKKKKTQRTATKKNTISERANTEKRTTHIKKTEQRSTRRNVWRTIRARRTRIKSKKQTIRTKSARKSRRTRRNRRTVEGDIPKLNHWGC